MIVFRGTVKDDDFKTRDFMPPTMRREHARYSKTDELQACKYFGELIAKHPPKGKNALAWLEMTKTGSPAKTLRRYTAKAAQGGYEWELSLETMCRRG